MANSGTRPGKSYKDHDFYIDTWNVLGLYTAVKLRQVKTEMEKYKTENYKNPREKMEGKWSGGHKNFTVIYSCSGINSSGTSFLINRKYKQAIMNFKEVYEIMLPEDERTI